MLPVALPTRAALAVSCTHGTNVAASVVTVAGMVKVSVLLVPVKLPVHCVKLLPAPAAAVSVIGAPSGKRLPPHA